MCEGKEREDNRVISVCELILLFCKIELGTLLSSPTMCCEIKTLSYFVMVDT